MSRIQQLVGQTSLLLVIAVLAGLSVRARWRLWYAFALSLLVVAVHDSLVALWPARFYRGAIWRAHEMAFILIRLAMVVELTVRVFRRFPGALATARGLLALILLSTFAAVLVLPVRESRHEGFVGDVMPRVLNGTIWLFATLAILILWYRLPVHWFQKAVLLSYVPFLLVYTVAVNALGELGWQRAGWVDTTRQASYVLLLLYWNYTAWRPGPQPTEAKAALDDLATT